jgi:MFS family permease
VGGSFPNLGAPLGFFCAYGVNLLLEQRLSPETMVAWGWRMPFLLSAVLVVVGLLVRERMSETPVFKKAVEEDRVVRSPLYELVKYWKQVVLGTCAMGITYTLFCLLGTWSLSYSAKNLGFTQTDRLKLELAAVFFFAAFIVVGCLAADMYGRRPVLLLATLLTVVFSFFSPQLLAVRNAANLYVFLAVSFCLMGGLFGPCGAYLPELFPAKVRYSESGLAYNLASILGGVFAPTIAMALVLAFGIQSVGWYLLAMSVVALVVLLLIKESKDVSFEE